MLKILILDDEPLIAEALYQYAQEHFSDKYEVFLSNDEDKVLQMLERFRFDIIITDIEMPCYDGIYLHGYVKERYPDCRVIFFTAHSKFDYAYYANRYNTKIILKSEGFEYLFEVVSATANEIYEKMFQESLLEKIETNQDKMTDDMMHLLRRQEYSENDIRNILCNGKTAVIQSAECYYVLFHFMEWNHEQICPAVYHVNRILQSRFSSIYHVSLWITEPNRLMVVFQELAEAGVPLEKKYIENMLELFHPVLCKLIKMKILIGLSDRCANVEEFVSCYHRLCHTIKPYEHQPEELICTVHECREISATNQQVIHLIDRYIHEHYAEDISLSDIAGHVYLSPTYVSRIYKKEKGINIVAQIQKIRLQKAMQLLLETNMKINDIAAEVGFTSARYFNTLFKHWKGMTPKTYREYISGREKDDGTSMG